MENINESCETKLVSDIRCSFSWKIETFKNCKEKNREKRSSETFLIFLPDGKVTNWQLDMYPKGASEKDDGDISVFLTSNNDQDIRTHFSLSFLDPSGKKQGTKVANEFTFSATSKPPTRSYGFAPLIKSREVLGLKEEDRITIVCDMIV